MCRLNTLKEDLKVKEASTSFKLDRIKIEEKDGGK